MKTKTIGELLLAERVRRGLTIGDVSAATKIRAEYIQFLEENTFESLPASTFVKGYIASLAALYDIAAPPLMATLRRDFKESAQGILVPREFLRPVFKSRAVWTPVMTTITILVLIFCTLLSYVGVQWWQLQKPPALRLINPAEGEVVRSPILLRGQTSPKAVLTVNAQPIALFPDGRFETEYSLPREGTQILTIEAVDARGRRSVIQRLVRVDAVGAKN